MKLAASALWAMIVLLGSGCMLLPPTPESVPAATPATTPAPAPAVTEAPAPPPAPVQAPQPTSPRVAILLSDGKSAYQNVAAELIHLLPDSSVYNLADDPLSPQLAMDSIAETQIDAVVAIGLRAAIAAKTASDFPVVFCQVFNYNDHDLVADRFKGVASLPPLALQVAAWKHLDPNLKNVGAILGNGHENLIAEAASATEQHGVKLHYRTARSDRETLYLFNQLLPHIDGFWLFPDNRVLSRTVLLEMLDQAARHNVQVAVFNDSLLDLGATISSSAVAADIASRIAAIVDLYAAGAGASVPDMTALTEVDVHTNDAVLGVLGLTTRSTQTTAAQENAQ